MTMHEEWTDRLSDYLDGELTADEAAAVDAHLQGCAACTAVLNDLKRVVAQAQAAAALTRPPQADLWAGIAARIDAGGAPQAAAQPVRGHASAFAPRSPHRVTFTLPQLAAAALVVAAVSGGLAWQLRPSLPGSAASFGTAKAVPNGDVVPRGGSGTGALVSPTDDSGQPFRGAEGARVETVSLADAQYDAAVSDLEKALKTGRGRLDASTIAIVEHNLHIIDQAISQAREALVGDPANSYLNSHLVEARRRKLDLLRRATALTTDMD
jgi:anti-sigma factor RsiW